MQDNAVAFISSQLGLNATGVLNVLKLIDDGATTPFIARYRKEMTGSMDEVKIGLIRSAYDNFHEIEKRKATIIQTITEQDKMTDELLSKITDCFDLGKLEDIYLPYKPKRQSRAEKARLKGLEPLAGNIMKQTDGSVDIVASRFINDDVASAEDAIDGALDIIAEWVSESESSRNCLRRYFDKAYIFSKLIKGKEEEAAKFSDFFDFKELLKRCPSHRFLAMQRGANEGFLKIGLKVDDSSILLNLNRIFVKGNNERSQLVQKAVADAYKRLLFPSIETECMSGAKDRADAEAISVFAENLKQLLLSAPLGGKRVLAIDPGFRTGCKLVCLDASGNLMHNETIYPHPPKNEAKQAASKVSNLVETYKIEAIAIGNGTAGRETEVFIQNIAFSRNVQVFVVSEDGASIYSASDIARNEFPDYDITVRGAVSIGRRLMDPLAELVKIDPKSIGVGQYQHDVNQDKLKKSLDSVVESCVNRVGVNVNTASKYLLTYISGLGAVLAENIVSYIKENGPFSSRSDLKNVKRMGSKAYEQCAGFLRIEGADNPLDNSSVHPESYYVAIKMSKDLNVSLTDMIGNEELCKSIVPEKYVDQKCGIPTIKDIISELKKPTRDPRQMAKAFSFDENVHDINDVEVGMQLPAIITNITNFGAFADIGVHQDGLIHISEMSDNYISSPLEVVSMHQQLMVRVIDVDKVRRRISLSLKNILP